ncbi:uncharacterized protein LOC120278592 [Dioscorea cayenensis subsp. rotundata]|uniref:Uncharacterized protein LOC120278592 n=1 Tax=Dioscorea cayennensis subsp. rotundata TaxID=55577 RepID=A0AB40CR48_DIOCR|nr:uncharacterized protein LOC120278592 [Dioscorea cayenensis subsp. rotundata]
MEEDEMISKFTAELMDIANQAAQLGKRYSNGKLVRKILRSLPKRFEAKVAVIEEAHDISTTRLVELMGSLQAFEMNMKSERKNNEDLKDKATVNHVVFKTNAEKELCQCPTRNSQKEKGIRKVRVKKMNSMCGVAYTSAKTPLNEDWYFDNGCSRHMIRNKSLLKNYKNFLVGEVTFGDGQKSEVVGKGTLMLPSLPDLKDVLHVDGLKVNPMSISQLCDQNMIVKFTKDSCMVYDKIAKCVLTSARSSDNCYLLQKLQRCYNTSCNMTQT